MSSDYIIEVEGLSKIYQIYESPKDRLRQMLARKGKRHYREFVALRDLSFRVEKGRTIGIIGRNGSGKSTLLQMICGTLTPTCGNIRVNGRVAALLELGAGFNPEFTGRENVFISAALYGLSREQTASRFERILAFAEIGDFVDQPVKNYSSGMFVRLAFAVIAHVDADILVVDEALAVGDVFFQQKCMRFLRSFQALGGTMLFVSHDTSAVINLCQSAVWLKNSSEGEYLTGPADEVCKAYLKDFYEQQTMGLPALPTSASDLRPISADDSIGRIVYAPDPMPDNLIEISRFKPASDAFGVGGATFSNAVFVNAEGRPIYAAKAGDQVSVRLSVYVHKSIAFPAFGITVKDRLGQFIISEGTDGAFRSSHLTFKPGDVVTAEFSFRMPVLLHGHYSVDIAFAEGLGNDHIQHHWIHDAISITSLKGRLVQGITGLPDLSLNLILESPRAMETS
jgi:lipopolysaccharide transport system ATP-binding protein